MKDNQRCQLAFLKTKTILPSQLSPDQALVRRPHSSEGEHGERGHLWQSVGDREQEQQQQQLQLGTSPVETKLCPV